MATKLTKNVQFPLDNYIIRCTDEEFGPSKSSGKPMITLKFEVVSPENVNIAGEEYTVAGVQTLPMYLVTKSIDADGNVDMEKTANIKKRLDAICKAFELPEITDPENPTLGFKGKVVWALVRSESQERRKAPSAEQLAKGIRVGDVLCNPVTGQPLVNYSPKVDEIYGLAPL